jgi:nucleotide-binding universal stress UspA family protein
VALTLTTILVPLDGSPLAARALQVAAGLARRSGARLVLVGAVPRADPARFAHPEALRLARECAAAEATLAAAAGGLRRAGIAAETDLVTGGAPAAILAAAEARDARLLVLSTHGRGGLERWLYGSVADAVLRRAAVPVLLVPPGAGGGGWHGGAWPPPGADRVVVPLDGSALAEEALGPAGAVAGLLGGRLLLLRVVPARRPDAGTGSAEGRAAADAARAYLRDVAGRGRAADSAVPEPEISVVGGYPPAAIAAAAHTAGAALIAMTTHGRGGLARLLLGSVATETLQLADVPLLLVRPAAVRHPPSAADSGAAAAPGRPVRVALTPEELDLLARGLAALARRAAPGPRARAARLLHRLEQVRAAGPSNEF